MGRRSLGRHYYESDCLDWAPPDLEFPPVEKRRLKEGYVTVVIATFLRPEVLKIAIESVLSQTFTKWRLVIVGDCTSTESVKIIDSFRDNRIRFINFHKNYGDQSAPNSIGARLCETEYLAFLSQDDIWYPSHLDRAIGFLRDTKSDFFLSSSLRTKALQNIESAIEIDTRYETKGRKYQPSRDWDFVASTWVFKAELSKRIGDWKPLRQVRYASSQDFLFRCWASGAKILHSPSPPSVLIVPSITVDKSYASDSSTVQKTLYGEILNGEKFGNASRLFPTAPATLVPPSRIRHVLAGWQIARRAPFSFPWITKAIFFFYDFTVEWAIRFGIAPWEYALALLGVKKGYHKEMLDEKRGL